MKKLAVLLIDFAVIFGSIILSFLLLKNEVLLNFETNIGAFYYVSPAIVLMYIILAYVFGMYNLRKQSVSDIIYTVFIVSIALTICIMAACFFIRESATSYPRSVILLSTFIYFMGLVLWRTLLRSLYYKTHTLRKVMIVGKQPDNLVDLFKTKYKSFYEITHICNDNDTMIDKKTEDVQEVFLNDDVSEEIRERIFLLANERNNLVVNFLPKLNDIGIINAKLQKLDDMPVHTYSKMFLSEEERFVKRLMDISISLGLLIVFSPIIIIIAGIIKLDGGHVFFLQERLTQNHKSFKMIKFRSMISNAEAHTGPTLSTENDNRITKAGRYLRNTRLDELPQLINVLKGEMSMVGPRPERPYFINKLEQDMPEFRYRLNVKAGLTGLAQVMGKYNTSSRQKLQYDIYYINNYSVFKDVLIMLKTIKIFFTKG